MLQSSFRTFSTPDDALFIPVHILEDQLLARLSNRFQVQPELYNDDYRVLSHHFPDSRERLPYSNRTGSCK